ncbi:MAG: ABC transporter ATP-binding protein [Propionibacteriales bacterium]|nr:ABC transporter ATP-binding protein [Propionibacteriales bacterium]
MNPEVPTVELVGVSLTYAGPPVVAALHDVDLRLRRNEYVAVVGPSGSGKSTLLNILGLLDRPTGGTFRLSGIDVSTLPEADRAALRGERIGFVFQSFHLLEHRTAVENLLVATLYRPTKVGRADRVARAEQVLTRVGMRERMYARPAQLSGGERQRVAIARALMNAPDLLLCDEPTGNLDSVNAAKVLALIDEVHQAGQTVVVITHDPVVAARAERRIAITDGSVTESG